MKHLEAGIGIVTTRQTKQRRIVALLFVCAVLLAIAQLLVTQCPQLHRSLTDDDSASASSVRIADVTYVGHRDSTRQQIKYLGIPYANPPVHALRFRPPIPYIPNSNKTNSVQRAVEFGPSCPQSTPVPYPISEDCLTANVWVPDVSSKLKASLGEEIENGLPILVWIYGGAFINGSTQKYPADDLVQASIHLGKPVIVASFNYRLGMFGFPLGAESAASNARNLGLLDQRLALEWIHTNIAQFGGDPSKITIFGESAGSVSVGAQMSYRGGKTGNIFRGAIMQSGTPSTMSTTILSKHTRQSAYDTLAEYLSCAVHSGSGSEFLLRESFECVRRASSEDLQSANWDVLKVPGELRGMDPAPIAFGPAIHPDDPFFFDEPAKIARAHQFANVSLIIGGTLDEGTDFVPSLNSTPSLFTYFSQTRPGLTFGIESPSAKRALERFIDRYPDDPAQGSPFGTGAELFGRGRQTKRGAAVFGDWLFEAPRREFTREAVKAGLPVWSYQFSQPGYWPPEYGVGHFADIQMIFRWFDDGTPREMIELSDIILSYWFAPRFTLSRS
ncbi:hypothetical protein FRC12_001587 [Ceratobasidium sp. 428]|nr:hypothetical protein FRC12_001587 [Ceratobasidium sp. 428]